MVNLNDIISMCILLKKEFVAFVVISSEMLSLSSVWLLSETKVLLR